MESCSVLICGWLLMLKVVVLRFAQIAAKTVIVLFLIAE